MMKEERAKFVQLTDNLSTTCEGIPHKRRGARADGAVIQCLAQGSKATRSRAWVYALVVGARLVPRAVSADGTFGPAAASGG